MSSVNGRGLIFPGSDDLTDNIAFLEFCESSRRLMYAASMELGGCAAEVEARLRTLTSAVPGGGVTLGMARHRATQVGQPLQAATDSLAGGARSMALAAQRFQRFFAPELEAVGYQTTSRRPDFKFRAG